MVGRGPGGWDIGKLKRRGAAGRQVHMWKGSDAAQSSELTPWNQLGRARLHRHDGACSGEGQRTLENANGRKNP